MIGYMVAPNFTFQNPILHARIVQDNHYGIRMSQSAAEFIIDTTDDDRTFARKIHDREPMPPLPGLHYIVSHSHANAINPQDNLMELYQKVSWDIILLKKILFEIPRCYHNAITILSKEISMDIAFKKHLENMMQLSLLAAPPFLQTPPEAALPDAESGVAEELSADLSGSLTPQQAKLFYDTVALSPLINNEPEIDPPS